MSHPDERPVGADVSPGRLVRAAAALVVIEATGVAAYTVAFVLGVLPLREPWLARLGFVLGVVAFLIGSVVALVAAARGLLQRRSWPRAFLVVAQILLVSVGWPIGQGGVWTGWALVGLAAVTGGLLLHPALGVDSGSAAPS